MNAHLEAIRDAEDWDSYYEAFKAAYAAILHEKWAIGSLSFAGQLHHPAVPDVSSAREGIITWAAFSQPSLDGIRAFLSVFADLLRQEPHRVRSNHYLFFSLSSEGIPPEGILASLGECRALVSCWLGSFEEELKSPRYLGPLRSIEALLGRLQQRDWSQGEIEQWSSRDRKTWLRDTRSKLLAGLEGTTAYGRSFVERSVVDSSLLLAAFLMDIRPVECLEIIGGTLGSSAFFAGTRARESNWGEAASAFFDELWSLSPSQSRDYTVRAGDTVSHILRREYELPFNRTLPLFAVLNPEVPDPNKIRVGQIIRLPVFESHRS